MHSLNNSVPWAGVLFFKRASTPVFAYFYMLRFNFRFAHTEYSHPTLTSALRNDCILWANMPEQPCQQVHHGLPTSMKSLVWVSHHWMQCAAPTTSQFPHKQHHFSSGNAGFQFSWLMSLAKPTQHTGLNIEGLVSAWQDTLYYRGAAQASHGNLGLPDR